MQKIISTSKPYRFKQTIRTLFLEDLSEDLRDIDESRIAGLGVSVDQLKEWMEKRANSILSADGI